MTRGRVSVYVLIASRRDSRSHPRKEVVMVEPFTSSRKEPHHVLELEAHPIVV